jgi:2-oxoglutarate ferredoxin oxidoreductase subunit alpha
VILVPELNYEGQFANLVSSVLGRSVKRLNRVSGEPLQVDEILKEIRLLNGDEPPPTAEVMAIQGSAS